MDSVRRQLQRTGLARIADAVKARSQKSIRLRIVGRSAGATTRFGGRPNLPREFAWPVRRRGWPLSFIAQLDLSQLPMIPGLPLPRYGALYFFFDADDKPWGYDPKDDDASCVMYSPSQLSENKIRAPHVDLGREFRFRGFSLATSKENTFPGENSGIVQEFHLSDLESDVYLRIVSPSEESAHRIGGYADELQGDLALQAQFVSHGIYCGTPSGYKEGRKRGLECGVDDWRLLLQVDSDARSGMTWGDVGRLYFLIREDDLRKRKFDKARTIIASH